MALARAKAFEDKKKETQNRGLSKDAQIEYKLKEKRMADAEALKKEKGDNYNMKVSLQHLIKTLILCVYVCVSHYFNCKCLTLLVFCKI